MKRQLPEWVPDKALEFVDEAVRHYHGRIVSYSTTNTGVIFHLADCDTFQIEDFVNQRLGHYAYCDILDAMRLDAEHIEVSYTP